MAELVIALDVDREDEALELAQLGLEEGARYVKVGMQLFYSAGPMVVRDLVARGARVVVDLKLHDIPNTMAMAARALCRLGASLITVHASAGRTALAAVAAVARECDVRLMAVTVLTSLDNEALKGELGVGEDVATHALRLATLAQTAGVHGAVCAAREVGLLKQALGQGFLTMVPGVRPVWAARPGDQARVATPAEARENGADYIVVGRPILSAVDRRQAIRLLVSEITAGNGRGERGHSDGAGGR